eukprot:Gb_07278 [translate_table: standard]
MADSIPDNKAQASMNNARKAAGQEEEAEIGNEKLVEMPEMSSPNNSQQKPTSPELIKSYSTRSQVAFPSSPRLGPWPRLELPTSSLPLHSAASMHFPVVHSLKC